MKKETKRQILHASTILFALFIPLEFVTREFILAALLIGGLVGYYALTKPLKKQFFRTQEHKRKKQGKRTTYSVFYYPLSIFLCFLLFPTYIAVSAWTALAIGDASSTLVGKKGRMPLFWNKKKTLLGFETFFFTTILTSTFFVWWVNPGLHPYFTLFIASLTALTGAVIESISSEINDNLSVPLITGLVLYAASILLF